MTNYPAFRHDDEVTSASAHRALYTFGLIIGLLVMADAIMSYVAPVVIEANVANPLIMGIIISTSSMVGLACDFLLPKFFPNRPYTFFTRYLIMFALLFPLTMALLPTHVFTFLLAMAIWGIYYEYLRFAQFNFIHATLQPAEHALGWGTMELFKGVSLTLSPLVSAVLIDRHEAFPYLAAIASLMGAATVFLFLRKTQPTPESSSIGLRSHHPQRTNLRGHQPHSWQTELRVWKVLMKTIWPIYLFYFSLILLDTGFWTIGTLLSENLRHQSAWGGFLLPAFTFPTLITALFAARLAKPWGKKRMAFGVGLTGAVILMISAFWVHSAWLVPMVLLASFFISISFPEIFAVFEDYMSRLGHLGDDIVGLQSSASSLAYIVGPIIAGVVASRVGYQNTLGVLSGVLVFSSLLALWIVPRKVRLPQQELVAATKQS